MLRPLLVLLAMALLGPVARAASTISPSVVTLPTLPILPILPAPQQEFPDRVVVSVREQKLMLVQNGAKVAVYPVSTSKYGLGDFWGRMTTPLGYLRVAQKIGDHAPVGAQAAPWQNRTNYSFPQRYLLDFDEKHSG